MAKDSDVFFTSVHGVDTIPSPHNVFQSLKVHQKD